MADWSIKAKKHAWGLLVLESHCTKIHQDWDHIEHSLERPAMHFATDSYDISRFRHGPRVEIIGKWIVDKNVAAN